MQIRSAMKEYEKMKRDIEEIEEEKIDFAAGEKINMKNKNKLNEKKLSDYSEINPPELVEEYIKYPERFETIRKERAGSIIVKIAQRKRRLNVKTANEPKSMTSINEHITMKKANTHMTKEEIEERIEAKLKWEKFDNYELKITNRIAHCNICRHEIQKDEQRAIVNPQVVSRRYLACLKCLKLLKEKNR